MTLAMAGVCSPSGIARPRAGAARPLWVGQTAARHLHGWDGVESLAADDVGPGSPAGRDATQFLVHAGDTPVRSGERTELVAARASTGALPGGVRTYRWSTYFPTDLNPVPDSTWNIFTQWHESAADGCHPNIALQVNTTVQPARLRLQVRGGRLGPDCAPSQSRSWDFGELPIGAWTDFALTVGWSSGARGYVQLAVGGRPAVARTSVATLYEGQGAYLKQGFYRAPQAATSRIFHSALTVYEAPVRR
jgi:hypothetical protein